MITEQQLKANCTPELIKKMVELAEGFEFVEYDNPYTIILFDDSRWFITNIIKWVHGPLLIHRAVEGINNDDSYPATIDIDYRGTYYSFKNYSPSSLTHVERAMLACLLDILEEK